MSRGRHRRLAIVFACLAFLTLVAGGFGFAGQSDFVLLLALTPLFGVLALAFGVSARDQACESSRPK